MHCRRSSADKGRMAFGHIALNWEVSSKMVTWTVSHAQQGDAGSRIEAYIQTTDDEGEIVGWGNPSGRERVEFRTNANKLRCEHGAGNRQGDTNVNDGGWHHVAVTVK